jgi:hypothetical protein
MFDPLDYVNVGSQDTHIHYATDQANWKLADATLLFVD